MYTEKMFTPVIVLSFPKLCREYNLKMFSNLHYHEIKIVPKCASFLLDAYICFKVSWQVKETFRMPLAVSKGHTTIFFNVYIFKFHGDFLGRS